MPVELDEGILCDVLRSLPITDDQERRPEDRAILGPEEGLIPVVDVSQRASSRLAGDIDSPPLHDLLHIDPMELTVMGGSRYLRDR